MLPKKGICWLKFEIWTGIILVCTCVYLGACLWGTEWKHSKQKEELIQERMTRDKLEGQWELREQRGMPVRSKDRGQTWSQERIVCLLVSNL